MLGAHGVSLCPLFSSQPETFSAVHAGIIHPISCTGIRPGCANVRVGRGREEGRVVGLGEVDAGMRLLSMGSVDGAKRFHSA